MKPKEVAALFDQMAGSYDQQWVKMAPIRETMNLLIGAIFAKLPSASRVLCVGAGTGAEILYLANRFPGFTFTAVEPSARMLDAIRVRAADNGFAGRCTFHEGFLESLPVSAPFDAATCLLVSQFLVERSVREELFRNIAQHVRSEGILVSADLSAQVNPQSQESLQDVWFRAMGSSCLPEDLERMRAMYARDVSVLPIPEVQKIIASVGFEEPVQFFQAGLIHAWYAARAV
jgi:tRNA (cmo5U34)-methyltransferase